MYRTYPWSGRDWRLWHRYAHRGETWVSSGPWWLVAWPAQRHWHGDRRWRHPTTISFEGWRSFRNIYIAMCGTCNTYCQDFVIPSRVVLWFHWMMRWHLWIAGVDCNCMRFGIWWMIVGCWFARLDTCLVIVRHALPHLKSRDLDCKYLWWCYYFVRRRWCSCSFNSSLGVDSDCTSLIWIHNDLLSCCEVQSLWTTKTIRYYWNSYTYLLR